MRSRVPTAILQLLHQSSSLLQAGMSSKQELSCYLQWLLGDSILLGLWFLIRANYALDLNCKRLGDLAGGLSGRGKKPKEVQAF